MKRILYVAFIGSVFVTGAQAQSPQNSATNKQNCSRLRSLATLPYEHWCGGMANAGYYSDYMDCIQSPRSVDEWERWKAKYAKDFDSCQKPAATTTR